MKVSLINYNYNKNIQFQSDKEHENKYSEKLGSVLHKQDCLNYNDINILIETNSIPTFNKPHFKYEDYQNLSQSEKSIIKLLNNRGNDKQEHNVPRNLSINKYAEHILNTVSKTKEELDKEYKNGYRLVGIGRSPAPFVETMQLLGADAISMPFSRQILYGESFPYEYIVGGPRPIYRTYQKYTSNDWKNYFKYFDIDNEFNKRTGKTLIFTDTWGETLFKTFTSIVKGLNFDEKNTKIIMAEKLFHHYDYTIFNVYQGMNDLVFKPLARMNSVNHAWGDHEVNPYKHPEFIPSLPEPFISKLFRCALYDIMTEKNLKIFR